MAARQHLNQQVFPKTDIYFSTVMFTHLCNAILAAKHIQINTKA